MSLARRLLLASVVLSLFVAAAFAALMLTISTLRDANRREARTTGVTAATLRLEKLVFDLETGVRALSATGVDRFRQLQLARRDLPGALAQFDRLRPSEPAQSRRAANLSRSIRNYDADYVQLVIRLVRDSPEAAASAVASTENQQRIVPIRALFRRFLTAEADLAASRTREADRRSDQALLLGGLGLAGSVGLIALFGIYLARSIGGPVRAAAAGASRIAGGELSLRLPQEGPGEVGELTRSFNAMAQGLESNRAELERQNAKLRESERLKTELMSIVSHELRTPLASVVGFTSLLLQRDFDPEARRHYLGIVDGQARRLASLLDDFLDVQQIEAGRLALAQELVDLAPLLASQLELYAAASPRHRLELELREQPLTVRGDANRLAQVVGNLLSNAIKYSPQGGRVEVEGGRDNGSVRVTVRDEGLGIAHSQQGRIFTKFFRGEAGASGIGGTGLGLAFSREIVEAHGGRIGFDSVSGRGSTFWLELPDETETSDRNGNETRGMR